MKKYTKLILVLIFCLALFLRLYKLIEVPPGLYIDEVSIGYNAYSILKNGVDEHGRKYPLWFEAFGEYKLPVYIYLTTMSIVVFGKNEFAVRFPSAFFGSLSILAFYFLIKEIFTSRLAGNKFFKNQALNIALLSSFLLAISSWHLQLSRPGFEVNLALTFFIFGSLFSVLFWKKGKMVNLFLGFLFFILTFYTYNSFRIITPIYLVFLSIVLLLKYPQKRKEILCIGLLFLILSLPMINFSFSSGGRARFLATTAFNIDDKQSFIDKWSDFFFVFLQNFFAHFSLNFLFNSGDHIGRHGLREFGVLAKWQLPFLFLGFFTMFKNRKTALSKLLGSLLILSPIPAALTTPSPHCLRSFLLILPLEILIAVGIIYLWVTLKNKWRISIFTFICLLSLYEFIFYLHYYYVHYPKTNIIEWGAGYKQVVEKVCQYKDKYEAIVVNNQLGHPYIYFLFYNDQIQPIFIQPGWEKPKDLKNKPLLYVTNSVDKPSEKMLDIIYLPNSPNKDIFARLWEI